MSTTKKRTYNSESRQQQSIETKNRILAVAKKLFELKGFDKVTIENIAKTAKVSAPLIYSIFLSKRGILLVLIDEALPREQYMALVNQVKDEQSPHQLLKIAARISRQLYDAEKTELNMLRGASILDPEFKELEMEREKRRYDRQKPSLTRMARKKVFVDNLTFSQIRDILWAFTGRDLYRMLVIEQKWTSDEYETWLAELLIKTLLKC